MSWRTSLRRLVAVMFAAWLCGLVWSATAAAQTTNICTEPPPTASAPSAGGVATAPLTVVPGSHVVVLEYEAWFGHRSGIVPQPQVTTCLQSQDMQSLGGGYDSADPTVIAQHVQWIAQMGIDAVTLDLTNNVSCIFDSENPRIFDQACGSAAFRDQNVGIRDNDATIYETWPKLGTRLKVIPLLGAFDEFAVTPDVDDPARRTSLEKEFDYFGALMDRAKTLSVFYNGKPLVLVYLGTPIQPARFNAVIDMIRKAALDRRFTIKLVGGYLDSQQLFWQSPDETPTGPIAIAPKYGFWSIVDRINFWGAPPMPYYPTYNAVGARIENMTVSVATAGQNGWNCATAPNTYSYCPDAALRYCGEGFANGCQSGHYETLGEFFGYARALQPTFLIVDQFNEFAQPDEGWNAETNDDIEPTRQWGYGAMSAAIAEIAAYRAAVQSANPSN